VAEVEALAEVDMAVTVDTVDTAAAGVEAAAAAMARADPAAAEAGLRRSCSA
jgi:hypothetical protein